MLAAILGLSPGCRDDGQDDGASGEDTASTSEGEATGSGGTGDGTADETGSGDAADTEDLGPWTSLDERPCPDDSFLTYENFGGPFILSYCTTCHASRLPADMRQGSPIEVDFDDIDDIRAFDDRIWIRAADQNFTMPPVGPPPEDERALLGEWLACGAPTEADLGL
ncbi:hypothetical protein [Paraliomyxa miuraensis]|uniref:hypothetical protein n=1 Tax=Paraliomyxa miuraensis TaxID=376150 RepID=UPI00225155FC|nr:hypothetical protein [Paraliomyxa miuraensis]MCX4241218.1 hypothetical protein [Paraliomyxa miuraensis]